jgi:NH3-dependent NAD+ synthetase/predicted amidohydrolase
VVRVLRWIDVLKTLSNIVYSAINSTVFDYLLNYERVVEVMKRADVYARQVNAGLHVISALPLTGPMAQAYTRFINSCDAQPLMFIKRLVKQSSFDDSDLTTLISFPWYHRADSKEVGHPFYFDSTNQLNNRPFYATAIIHKGQIAKLHLESYFEYYEGGPYDDRYFAKWPMGLREVVLIDGDEIEVGSFAVSECGIASNPTQAKYFIQAHPTIQTIILNGAGFYQKETVKALSQLEQFQPCTLISGNPLGSDSGDQVGSGEVFVYKNGIEIYCTSEDKKYSFTPSVTQVVPTNTSIIGPRLNPHVTCRLDLSSLLKASALWLRDYLLKTKQQGFVISMSDSVNSAYSLMVANFSIDWAIQACAENDYEGITSYLQLNHFGHLKCKNEVLHCLKEEGAKKALRLLKNRMLACVYMPEVFNAFSPDYVQMKSLVDAIGASLQIFEISEIVATHFAALTDGLMNKADKKAFESIVTKPNVLKAAIERAQVTQAGIVGNMENKIGLSNASATAVALGHLHAGGAGQEGPISVTLSLFQTQILDSVKMIADTSAENIRPILHDIIKFAPSERERQDLAKKELIIATLIKGRNSPIATYRHLKRHEFARWDHKERLLLQDIDDACRIWSVSQPSRVALSVSPNLGCYGNSLDRYRSVRNTRDNQYFHNGRVELKLQFLGITDPNTVMVGCADAQLKDYLLNTNYEALDGGYITTLVQEYENTASVIVSPVDSEPRAKACEFPLPDGRGSDAYQAIQRPFFENNVSGTPCGIHIGTASLHQTMFDYARNSEHIKAAIQTAETNGFDLLLLPELCMTGYFGDGDFDWIKNQEEGDKIVRHVLDIAKYAEKSSLIISMGFPVFIKEYGKPFVGQALLHRGKIISISLKMTQPDGEGEYEAMHFTPFDIETMGRTFDIKITGQESPIPVGKPVVVVTDKQGNPVPIYHEQCAEAWIGVNDDGSVNQDIQDKLRYLNTVAANYPGLVVLNPSGSKNDVRYPKAMIRRDGLGFSALEKNPNIACYVYVNVVGDDNGTIGGDGDSFIISRDADGVAQLLGQGPTYTRDVGWGVDSKTRQYTEITYATAAWIINSLRHHKKQCFVISLSGGADSAFGAVQIAIAIDLFIKQHAQMSGLHDENAAKKSAIRKLFKDYFAHLNCKKSILEQMENENADAAIKSIKQHMLVCSYMPTDNSSKDTQLSAKTLIEGDSRLTGLGGRFIVSHLQKPMEACIISYSGRSENFINGLNTQETIKALNRQVNDWPQLSNIKDREALFEKIIVLFSEKELYDKAQLPLPAFPDDLQHLVRQIPLTWWEASHDLAKQNLQARVRSIGPWLLAQLYDGLPLFTSNLSEAAAGYSTWAGDTSLGYENLLGGIFKSDVREMLLMYEKGQLCGLAPISALFYVNHLEPSAELRPLEKGVYTQTDEKDLMPYNQLDLIISTMIIGKNTRKQTYKLLKNNPLFESDDDLVAKINKACWLFQTSQFKRTGGGNTPFLGCNLDPHLSQATTLLYGT